MSYSNPYNEKKIFTGEESLIILEWLETNGYTINWIDVYLKDNEQIHYSYSIYTPDKNIVLNETIDQYRIRTFQESCTFILDYCPTKPMFPYESLGIEFVSKIEDLVPLFLISVE
jgi:hypothetical protein